MNESTPPTYHEATRTPVYSLLLIAPFLLTYEVGLVILRESIHNYPNMNGADKLIRHLLQVLGLGGLFIGVLVLVAYFALWQWHSGASLKFKAHYAALSFVESAGWALALYVLPWQIYRWLGGQTLEVAAGEPGMSGGALAEVVLSCGAGVYEEFLFRVLLVSGLLWALRKGASLERGQAGLWAVLVAAVLFSLAHHLGAVGDPVFLDATWTFDPLFWPRFLFRTVAGLFFAGLYFHRCFGVAVAAHALYDILVFLLRA